MLDKDIGRVFERDLANATPDILLIDFLEERYGLIELAGNYYTGSGILKESLNDSEAGRFVPALSDEYKTLWKAACDKLIELILSVQEKCRVVLVENYLSEYLGNIYSKSLNTNIEIESINARLRMYYSYFKEKCPKATVISADSIPDDLIYTDEGFEHGAYPEHMNVYYYGYVANMIADYIA